MRAVVRFIGRWLIRPSSLGAMYLLALVACAASRAAQADQALGGQAREIHAIVRDSFGGEIARIGVAIGAAALVVGAVLGALSGLIVRLRERMARQAPYTRWRFGLLSLGVTVVLHAAIEARAMARWPQLFADGWYARGGYPRMAQVIVTDVLGPRGVILAALVCLLAFLAGPPSQWSRWPRRLTRALLPRARPRVGAAGTASAAALALVWLLRPPTLARAAAPDRPNILILAADSLRADRIDPRVAPNLAKLAERSVRFDHAYVSLPRTFPSWVTLLTGRYPHHHGIRSMFPRWEDRAKDFDAAPARFARAGYRTSVVSDFAGDIFDRIDLGFQHTRVPTFDFRQLVRQRALEAQTPLLPFLQSRLGRRAFPVMREMSDAADPDMLADDAIAEIHRLRGAPFFLTVFFGTAHFPYAAPAPYYRRYTDRTYRGRFKYHKPVGLEREADVDDADVAQIRGLYDGAIASVDTAAARVFAALGEEGLGDKTVIVVTADHGETLYDNGHGAGHGDHLFGDEGTHVPLFVYDPWMGGTGRREGRVVRDVDLAPTLYELAGLDAPIDRDGESLVPALLGTPIASRLAFAETGLWFTEEIASLDPSLRLPYPGIARLTEIDPQHGDEVVLRREMRATVLAAKHRMVRDERHKLVYAPTRAGVRYLLYDTVADPGETKDVASERPEVVARLKSSLWSFMLSDPDMVERGGMLVPRRSESAAPASVATPRGGL